MTSDPGRRGDLNLRRNTLWGVLEIFGSAIVVFLLYRMVVSILGLHALGIWSLVLATTSLVRLGDIGAATGLGRFVAIAHSRGQPEEAIKYIDTAIVTNGVLYSAVSLSLYWPLSQVLPLGVGPASITVAWALLPYSLVSFALMNINGAIAGSLLGLQRADLKSAITVVSLILQFIVAFLLTRKIGLVGLAVAQIIQYLFAIICGWIAVLRLLHQRLRIPSYWDRKIFRSLLGFGVKLQISNILNFLYEPGTKFVLSSIGGLDALGVYEMAQKLVQQVRQIVVGPSQVLMPAFAQIHDEGGIRLAGLYDKAVALSIAIGLPLMTVLAITSPLSCWLLLGRVNETFVLFMVPLCIGWFLNLVAAPAYILGVGTGRVGWNICGHIVSSGGSPLVGLVAGHFFGAMGVVVAGSSMLALGALLSMVMNCRAQFLTPLPHISSVKKIMTEMMKFRPIR